MDRITKSLLQEFVTQNDLQSLAEDTAFEHFAGFLAVSVHYQESFPSEDICVGAGGDCGIDCIGILVNGCLVTEPEEIQDLAETNGYLDVVFILVQAERSSSFESSKIGQFGFGVVDFFSESPSLPQNENVKLRSRITNEIFSRSSLFKKGNPQCFLYYITTGRWTDDQNLLARKEAVSHDLRDLKLFRRIVFECFDAETLQGLYRNSKNAIATEVLFTDRIVLPELPGVEQAFIGLLPATQFLKLIENSDEEVITSIFYDNVRHWQEWNPVNKEIKETLEDATQRDYFPLLNNGITIVARKITPTGNKFFIEDYQIVNGCQTSYVLHETRSSLNDNVLIPVRLVATDNQEIRNSIIKATNRQTEVTEDQLFALSDFPKKLEAYFPTFEGNKRLYYERRSRQYNVIEGIEKVRIINMTILVRSFASIFLNLPHRTTRNYKALLRSVGTEIFHRDHRLEPYYVSAYAHYRLEYLFRSQTLSSEMKAARYHLLLAYRMLANPAPLPRFNSHDMELYCNLLMETLWDDAQYKNIFERSAFFVRKVASGNLHRDNIRTEPFTVKLIEEIKISQVDPPKS